MKNTYFFNCKNLLFASLIVFNGGCGNGSNSNSQASLQPKKNALMETPPLPADFESAPVKLKLDIDFYMFYTSRSLDSTRISNMQYGELRNASYKGGIDKDQPQLSRDDDTAKRYGYLKQWMSGDSNLSSCIGRIHTTYKNEMRSTLDPIVGEDKKVSSVSLDLNVGQVKMVDPNKNLIGMKNVISSRMLDAEIEMAEPRRPVSETIACLQAHLPTQAKIHADETKGDTIEYSMTGGYDYLMSIYSNSLHFIISGDNVDADDCSAYLSIMSEVTRQAKVLDSCLQKP